MTGDGLEERGAGRWLSGRDGAVIAEFGAALREPIVGDRDADGNPEVFRHKKWFEVQHAGR